MTIINKDLPRNNYIFGTYLFPKRVQRGKIEVMHWKFLRTTSRVGLLLFEMRFTDNDGFFSNYSNRNPILLSSNMTLQNVGTRWLQYLQQNLLIIWKHMWSLSVPAGYVGFE